MIAASNNISNHFSVPFGLGAKYMVSQNATIGFEWGFRKTFRDNIDGVVNPGGTLDKSSTNNADWYSFAGFFITFRLFNKGKECPVYK
jgi:hypothetical protein